MDFSDYRPRLLALAILVGGLGGTSVMVVAGLKFAASDDSGSTPEMCMAMFKGAGVCLGVAVLAFVSLQLFRWQRLHRAASVSIVVLGLSHLVVSIVTFSAWWGDATSEKFSPLHKFGGDDVTGWLLLFVTILETCLTVAAAALSFGYLKRSPSPSE